MTLAAGNLRHRVTLQQQQMTVDPVTNEPITVWADVAELWAHVEPLSVREFIASAAGQSELTARITIRYRSDVNANMRFLHRGKVYNVHGAQADKESGLEYLTLPVSEGVNNGIP